MASVTIRLSSQYFGHSLSAVFVSSFLSSGNYIQGLEGVVRGWSNNFSCFSSSSSPTFYNSHSFSTLSSSHSVDNFFQVCRMWISWLSVHKKLNSKYIPSYLLSSSLWGRGVSFPVTEQTLFMILSPSAFSGNRTLFHWVFPLYKIFLTHPC